MKTIFEKIRNIALYYYPDLGLIKLERLVNSPGNEMWRIGKGYNAERPFFRIDWGSKGWRWTWGINYFVATWTIYESLDESAQAVFRQHLDNLNKEARDNPNSHELIAVTRCHAVIRERKDLWQLMYAFALKLK